MKAKKVVCLIAACMLLLPLLSAAGFAACTYRDAQGDRITHYEYPITPDSEDWSNYGVHGKVEMLRIPEETLHRMTDEALVKAIAEYPYLCDLYVYGFGMEDGIQVTRSYFSALDELLKRDTAQESLKNYGLQIAKAAAAQSADPANNNERFVAYTMAELITTVCSDMDVVASTDKKTGAITLTTVEVPQGLSGYCTTTSDLCRKTTLCIFGPAT